MNLTSLKKKIALLKSKHKIKPLITVISYDGLVNSPNELKGTNVESLNHSKYMIINVVEA